jgi:site-specific DNA-cytosine methylase
MTHPLAIDLFCGLGGWTAGLLAEGFDVIMIAKIPLPLSRYIGATFHPARAAA